MQMWINAKSARYERRIEIQNEGNCTSKKFAVTGRCVTFIYYTKFQNAPNLFV